MEALGESDAIAVLGSGLGRLARAPSTPSQTWAEKVIFAIIYKSQKTMFGNHLNPCKAKFVNPVENHRTGKITPGN